MNIPARWFVEPIGVASYSGQGAYGDSYAEPVTLLGHVSGGRRVQGQAAQEVVQERRVMFPNPARRVDPDTLELVELVDPTLVLTPESRVTTITGESTASEVTPHVQPGTGRVVYVSGSLT